MEILLYFLKWGKETYKESLAVVLVHHDESTQVKGWILFVDVGSMLLTLTETKHNISSEIPFGAYIFHGYTTSRAPVSSSIIVWVWDVKREDKLCLVWARQRSHLASLTKWNPMWCNFGDGPTGIRRGYKEFHFSKLSDSWTTQQAHLRTVLVLWYVKLAHLLFVCRDKNKKDWIHREGRIWTVGCPTEYWTNRIKRNEGSWDPLPTEWVAHVKAMA